MVKDSSSSFKAICLCALVAQNTGLVIVTRYSKGVLQEDYIASSVVLMMELTKLIFSATCVTLKKEDSFLNNKDWSPTEKLIWLIKNSLVMGVPALCYFVQNLLAYTALENLSSSVYGVLQQAKILTAAIFSVVLLRKKISLTKWRALLLIFLGATLVEHHTFQEHGDDSTGNPVTGTIAMLTMISMSGFAGVYYEKMLKGVNQSPSDKLSVWDRNVQLATWSIGFAMFGLFNDRAKIQENGLFYGWSFVTVFQCFLMTSGGLLVAVIIKYCDVIIKGMATTIALITISLVGWWFLEDDLDLIFVIGMTCTILAVFNYNEKLPEAKLGETKLEKETLLPAGGNPQTQGNGDMMGQGIEDGKFGVNQNQESSSITSE